MAPGEFDTSRSGPQPRSPSAQRSRRQEQRNEQAGADNSLSDLQLRADESSRVKFLGTFQQQADAAPHNSILRQHRDAVSEISGDTDRESTEETTETIDVVSDTSDKTTDTGDISTMSPEVRKEAAARKLTGLIKAKQALRHSEIGDILIELKEEFFLSEARIEGEGNDARAALYASPALFVPLLKMVPTSGQRVGMVAQNRPSVKAGDYIKATQYDGPFDAPGEQAFNQLDNRFKNAWTTHDIGTMQAIKKVKNVGGYTSLWKVAANPGSPKLWSQYYGAPIARPGEVEAQTSVRRGAGRSGTGETAIGRMGSDEEVIKTGNDNTRYNGGHLIGDQLMDSHKAFDLYEDWNLAPQQASFNSPVYTSSLENPIVAAISNGLTVKYNVRVQYPDNTYTVAPSDLIKRLYPVGDDYRNEVLAAIAYNAALDANFTFTRRTPGYWRATAETVGGGTISSGYISDQGHHNIGYDNNPAHVGDNVNYQPVGEEVLYTLQTDVGTGWVTSAGPAGPGHKNFKYANAQKVQIIARQETF